MSEPLLTYRGAVYPWHCDHMGHMNVMWYVGKFDEATWQFFNAVGMSPSYLRAAKRGMAAVDQQISYLREVHAGAVVSITTTVIEVKEKSLTFQHEMKDDETGEPVARTKLKGVHLDTELRKSCAFEERIVLAVHALLRDGAD